MEHPRNRGDVGLDTRREPPPVFWPEVHCRLQSHLDDRDELEIGGSDEDADAVVVVMVDFFAFLGTEGGGGGGGRLMRPRETARSISSGLFMLDSPRPLCPG